MSEPHECADDGCEHASDCAVHNEPAFPAGPCNCGVDARVSAKAIRFRFGAPRTLGGWEAERHEPI